MDSFNDLDNLRSNVLKYPNIFGRPNSLLYLAAPIGASIIISSGVLILSGGCIELFSHGIVLDCMLRFDKVNPANPILGIEPIPVDPSSRISPPDPVAAPSYGAIAVG